MQNDTITPKFYPLVAACKAHGICRSVAYQLAMDGVLETFMVGPRRFVVLESLYALSKRSQSTNTN